MSEQEEMNLANKICEGILRAQKRLFERKSKLGESVVVADANGQPVTIPASEALRRLNNRYPEL